MSTTRDLHEITYDYDIRDIPPEQIPRQRDLTDGSTVIHFGDLTDAAVRFIEGSELIVGCVAWLTSEPVLTALAGRPQGVALVVQKEDFLRPDHGATDGWQARLRRMYEALPDGPSRMAYPRPLPVMNVCADWSVSAVRCVGVHNRDQRTTAPRMHHKFMIRCRVSGGQRRDWGWEDEQVHPIAVWTGSFNFTANGGRSLENAVEIHDPWAASAYLHEFAHVSALGEALDWRTEWAAPEWRIGT